MMNRRQFVEYLAATAVAGNTNSKAFDAFQHYYNMNTPLVGEPFVALDEIMLNGLASCSTALEITLLKDNKFWLSLGLNAFGGILRWVAAPDQKIIAAPANLTWRIRLRERAGQTIEGLEGNRIVEVDERFVRNCLQGHLSFIDQDGVRHSKEILSPHGSLA